MNDSRFHRASGDNITMNILGDEIPVTTRKINIYELKFLPENPRVYSCIRETSDFASRTEDEKQAVIFERMSAEPSVKNLKADIKKHNGLLENILVRHDTMEVIEGNSRLAVYRLFNEADRHAGWDMIQCDLVQSLTPVQQASFLSQIHVKGKTEWTAYEKNNFAYTLSEDSGWDIDSIAEALNESKQTVKTRINVIQSMKDNHDDNRSHFSFYDVMVRQSEIKKALKSNNELKTCLFERIRNFGTSENQEEFTAQELRDKLPTILKKPKQLRKFIKNNQSSLDDHYHQAKINNVQDKVKQARKVLEIERKEIQGLSAGELNAIKLEAKRLTQDVERLLGMIDSLRSV